MDGPARAHDRHARRRPFTNWMRRLANLKSSHSTSPRTGSLPLSSTSRNERLIKNNPYSTAIRTDYTDKSSISPSFDGSRRDSYAHSKLSSDSPPLPPPPPKSRAPTMATTADTIQSGAGTSVTRPRTEGDRDSTFSSPSPSVRSLTTTLTTLQSTHATPAFQHNLPSHSAQPPASAVPSHLVPHSHPITHQMATANNVLTDDASILTLASSSKRRRRNSLDTNASIRALAPASMFGNSRESLPLSMLSAHPDRPGNAVDNASLRESAYYPYPRSTSAMNAERSSLVSASGITAPLLTSERNSYIGSRPAGDGSSIRSGLYDTYHGRHDSLGGISVARERLTERDRRYSQEYFREAPVMVTAPTSPMPG